MTCQDLGCVLALCAETQTRSLSGQPMVGWAPTTRAFLWAVCGAHTDHKVETFPCAAHGVLWLSLASTVVH